jgi:hypothetical protein
MTQVRQLSPAGWAAARLPPFVQDVLERAARGLPSPQARARAPRPAAARRSASRAPVAQRVAPAPAPAPARRLKSSPRRFAINILACNRPKSLARLLASLDASDYDGDDGTRLPPARARRVALRRAAFGALLAVPRGLRSRVAAIARR